MLEINSKKIKQKELLHEIEKNIDKYKQHPKFNKMKVDDMQTNIYTVDHFCTYNDEEFIKNIFLVVLKRDVDETALIYYLDLLRSGKRSKTEILATIRFSKEGKENNVDILGIKKRYIMAVLYNLPLVGYFTKILVSLIFIPKNMQKANNFEAYYNIKMHDIDTKVSELNAIATELNIKTKELDEKLQQQSTTLLTQIDTKVNLSNFHKDMFTLESSITESLTFSKDFTEQKFLQLNNQMTLYMKDVNNAKAYLNDAQSSLKSLISQAKEQVKQTPSSDFLTDIIAEDDYLLDNFYVAFEDKFRGSREDIQKRQEYYLPLVKDVVTDKNDLVIDVGCGRGEWIELLKNNSIKARGIDLNRLMVNESISYDLDAITQDAIQYLKSLEEKSVAVITGFHIVEHLPFKVLIELFDESLRVLKTGGMIIFETPNPENIMVGSCSFYTDPTHVNPIPPVSLEFIATNRGFTNIKIHRLSPIKEPEFLKGENTHDVNDLIFAYTKEQDYSVVGYKI